MAAISSNTDIALADRRMLWANASSWVGGVVPNIVDDVTITGTRTTINQAAITKWAGTITITVASTTGFPTSGFFYAYTNLSDYIKVNYTGITATTFTGCSIDFTDPFGDWKYSTAGSSSLPTHYYNYNSQIQNGAFVYSPSAIITIPAGYQANVSTLIIGNGGILSMEPGSNLGANNWITLREGRFIGRANVGNVSTVMVNRLEGNGVGFFQTENFTMSVLDVDGGETRAFATVNTNMSIGATSINITPVQGSFAVDDEVAIYDTSWANTRSAFFAYRDIKEDQRYVHDEGFDVAGVVGNQLWLARRNGARGKIRQVGQVGGQKVLTVDKNDFLGQLNFKANDRVIIANTEYRIDRVADSEFQLGFYDFTAPGANLNDFLTDYSLAQWTIGAFGAQPPVAGGINVLVHKQFWRREMIIEAFMSPLTQFTTGTRGTDQYGLIFNYDPAHRNLNRNNLGDGVLTGSFRNQDSTNFITIQTKNGNSYALNFTNTDNDPVTPKLKTILQGPNTQRVEIRNNFIRAFVNNEFVTERWDSSGSTRGLFGVFAWNNTSVRLQTLKFSAVTQDLYITTANNFTVNDTVYEAGAELVHWAGERILKIASKVVNPGTHDDLAFSFRGAYAANSWPMPLNFNGAQNSVDLWRLTNHDYTYAHEIFLDLGTSANTNVTFDLASTQTFTHVAFTPRADDVGSATGAAYQGIQVLGSNDNVNFTRFYGPTNDTKRFCNPQSNGFPWYNQLGIYFTGTQTYRYVRFVTNGHNGSANPTLNRWIKFGVFNMPSNNHTIVVNNASDFANGDIITVLTHAPYLSNDDWHQFQAVKAGQNPDTYYHTSNTYSRIINKNGNTLFLDRPINYGFIEGQESVVKVNRNFKMLGFYTINGETKWQKPYFKINLGAALCQIRSIKNWEFTNVGSSRTSGGSWLRGVDFGHQDNWTQCVVDGASVIGYNNSDANGVTMQSGKGFFKNGYVGNVRDFRNDYGAYLSGFNSYNTKISNVFRFRFFGQGAQVNYNESAGNQHWDIFNVAWVDRYITPIANEARRNSFHGIYQIPSFDFGQRIGDAGHTGGVILSNEYNRIYATCFVALNTGVFPEHSAPLGLDIHAEHPGADLSFYRNEPFLTWFNEVQDGAVPVSTVKDWMRSGDTVTTLNAGYNVARQMVGTDFIRFYSVIDESLLPCMAFSVFCQAAVPIQMFIEFEYRMPGKVNLCGNSAIGNAAPRVLSLQNGTAVQNLSLPLPTNDGWVKYTQTFTGFTPQIGQANVIIVRRAPHSFFDFRNARAYVLTNNPESVVTLANTFDLNKYFNLSNDKKYMAPISANLLQFKTVKF